MNYELRQFDTPLMRFSATEDSNSPEIEILRENEDARNLLPLDLTVSPGGIKAVRAYCEKLGTEYVKALDDMLILDALIFNSDRHFRNFGFLVDNHTNQIVGLAPLFDHGNSLFNYAGSDDLLSDQSLTDYADTLLPAVYDDFVGAAKEVLTPAHKEGLRHLLNFHFKKHPRYNLPARRLKLLEHQIQRRAKELLE